MRIIKHGVVILTEQGVKVEDWVVERENSDPVDATPEQMLLEVVVPWAQHKLNEAIGQNLQRISKSRKATKNPTEN